MRYFTKEWHQRIQDLDLPLENNTFFNPDNIKEPRHIIEAMDNHDAYLYSIQKRGNDLIMLLDNPYLPDGVLPFRKIVFRNYQIIERESGIRPVFEGFKEGFDSMAPVFLHDEEYAVDGGYEIHMMFDLNHLCEKVKKSADRLRYLTLTCCDVECEDGIDPNKYVRRKIDINFID